MVGSLQNRGIDYFVFSVFAGFPELVHFVSTRDGGVSMAQYATLNLGFHVGDEPASVLENRRRLCAAVGSDLDALTVGQQVHGTRVQVVTSALRGRGARTHTDAVETADALITRERDTFLLVLVADCVPLLFVDPDTPAVGVAHAGWRGTVGMIAVKTVRAMAAAFEAKPEHLHVAIGPSIGPRDYQVGDEAIEAVRAKFPRAWLDRVLLPFSDGTHFDLWTANALQLKEAGVTREHIECANLSTFGERGTFFSQRRDGAPAGHFGAGILLRSGS